MSKNNKLYEEMELYSKELKLSKLKTHIKEYIKEANETEISYENFLHEILKREYERLIESRLKSRIRLANFPQKKYLEDLKLEYLPEDARKKLKVLKTLEFVQNSQNVILSGNPGTGKTHIAIGLGIKAILEGYRVLFITVPLLITQLKESRSNKTLRTFQNKFGKYDLVICDELGYISFDKEGSELLFTLLSLRAIRKSTIITTNLSFDRWEEIFNDPVLSAAMIDRLAHKAYLVNMNGNSYRLKETEEFIKSLE
ncbi:MULTISPECIES: IS21-like element helper ATPase IstB [Marinitoga]|jgi:DNA replication protein DnaC|uniref:IS21-like element helper ATPase IstB n=1 Tax=Marinitoga TaxID=160798 RepID=UPI0013EC0795|nr:MULTISPECIES: IS21-like element helper ATPase IstB [Marinitoga]KAF2955402.1 AAA family ATPase [Marinitoga sp. 38H-ov]MBM7560465.1 DNA replication protein DnaC [Marinitoga litoralis]